ncbi:involucrin-like [Etheostoma cragini]|uniref:involucrin-like n=1 Tax=Etheostoma cragini TaxID=417921 RepID=UPI00155E34E7|nr:involucrin-like [Etheostoma cragini]
MCKVQMLRALVEQRLTAAAEEIFGLFERTIAEYEEELCRSKEENERQRELLDAVFNPQLRVHRADVQQLSVVKEKVPPEQPKCYSSVEQQQQLEAPPHIKEEHEELGRCQEGEQLQELEEADITEFPFTPVSVKSEDDEEEAQSSQLHQRQTQHVETEADGEDCGGPEPARNSHPLLQPETEDQTLDSSEPETDDSADWKETREPQSALNSLKHDSTYVQQLLVVKEEVPPEQQECSSRVDQQEPETPPHIKEEPEDLWSSQEGEQLQGLEEADITKFPFTPVPVKREDDEDKAQSSCNQGDVQPLLVVKDWVHPEQLECFSSVDQQEPGSPPHIKEEPEELSSNVQQLSVVKEEVPSEQQECSSSVDQQESSPHIKKEQEEFWSREEPSTSSVSDIRNQQEWSSSVDEEQPENISQVGTLSL